MKSLGIVMSSVILICGCDEGSRFSSPTAPSVPVVLVMPPLTPTPEPQQRATYPVHGVVYEVTAKGQESIEGAWVTESSVHAGVFTAANGSYSFTGLLEGAITMNVSKDGYYDSRRDFALTDELRLDIELVRE